jgi:hypothetical protein
VALFVLFQPAPAFKISMVSLEGIVQFYGAVAQLGERRVRNAKVGSSILLRSTKSFSFPGMAGDPGHLYLATRPALFR